jgi:hypothetical protein
VTIWRSLRSLCWHHVSDRSPTPTTSSQTSRSTMAAPTPTSGCRPTTSPSRPCFHRRRVLLSGGLNHSKPLVSFAILAEF